MFFSLSLQSVHKHFHDNLNVIQKFLVSGVHTHQGSYDFFAALLGTFQEGVDRVSGLGQVMQAVTVLLQVPFPHLATCTKYTLKHLTDMSNYRSCIHNLSSCEIKAWKKNSCLNEILTHDLSDHDWYSALPAELSSQLGASHLVSS